MGQQRQKQISIINENFKTITCIYAAKPKNKILVLKYKINFQQLTLTAVQPAVNVHT
jgi:hypothetical protein